jgi:NAD(P)H-dependent FMN reductase
VPARLDIELKTTHKPRILLLYGSTRERSYSRLVTEEAARPTQGKTLAVMQVCGGSQSFNAVNQLRVLGRWMRMFTIRKESAEALSRRVNQRAI